MQLSDSMQLTKVLL